MCQHTLVVSISKAFYRVAAELCQAAQLMRVYLGYTILLRQYFNLCVLMPVFRVRYVMSSSVRALGSQTW